MHLLQMTDQDLALLSRLATDGLAYAELDDRTPTDEERALLDRINNTMSSEVGMPEGESGIPTARAAVVIGDWPDSGISRVLFRRTSGSWMDETGATYSPRRLENLQVLFRGIEVVK